LAEVLGRLGSHHVLVVHSEDGMDEISIGAPTKVAELKDGKVSTYTVAPAQFGLEQADVSTLVVDSAAASLAVINKVFDNEAGPARDIVSLNAGAAIYVAGLADSLEAGVAKAGEVIASGAARDTLAALVAKSKELAG
jgi:anthranilate phosphoribosyltransferase